MDGDKHSVKEIMKHSFPRASCILTLSRFGYGKP